MKYADSNKLGFNTALIAALSGTIAHYTELWFACYLIATMGGLLTAAIFYGD